MASHFEESLLVPYLLPKYRMQTWHVINESARIPYASSDLPPAILLAWDSESFRNGGMLWGVWRMFAEHITQDKNS